MEVEAPRSTSSEFVTVVSIDGDGKQNYVTVLSIDDKRRRAAIAETATATATTTSSSLVDPAHPEEVVEVYRLPGERLGFGLKFEGGNKTSERVRRLFIQSCAEQSPASRAKCSWGHLGEGDEVLAIDDAPVTQMTRLDCVRRLKESQLVIKLAVRCRGALRPEVVSAERKHSSNGQQQQEQRSKVPPELPAAPPPVPPRKLRHAGAQANRGSADGEASPGAKKSWDSPGRSSSTGSSATSSPQSQASYRSAASSNTAKSSSNYESCASSPVKSCPGSKNDSPKDSPKAHVSPVMNKARHEPPAEAQSYLDARSQDGSSTHGSTSDDTGSSLSTVVDRFSTSSDRFSTTSTTSTASEQFVVQPDVIPEINGTHHHVSLVGNGLVDFDTPDFLLTRLANSEARTHVESRGDVERVTAVVAPNTVLIEETPTLQPPLSFQDAPLSYGHEPRPGIFYTADLAADSRTHFRPIKDDAELVEKVFNGEVKEAPPLPVRNHVNRIAVNQQQEVNNKTEELVEEEVKMPVLPPKPMPRKDVKAKRKRPPPPPPPPRREPVPPVPEARTMVNGSPKKEDTVSQEEKEAEKVDVAPEKEMEVSEHKTNKVLEIVEMKKAKALTPQKASSGTSAECEVPARGTSASAAGRKSLADMSSSTTISIEVEETSDEENSSSPVKEESEDELVKVEMVEDKDVLEEEPMMKVEDDEKQEEEVESVEMKQEEEENEGDVEFIEVVRDQRKDVVEEEEEEEEEDVTDESDGDDYYWQSNLATIGEEEETNSLEYESANNEPPAPIEMPVEKVFETPQIIEDIIETPSEVTEKKETLEEAYRKLENLKENETSLTMNSEESSTEVERRAIDEIRQNKLQHIADSYKNTISQKSSSMNQDSLNSKSLHCQEKDSESTRSLSQGTNMSNRSMSMIEKPSGSKSLGSDCQETSSQSMHSQSQGTNMSSRSTSLIQKAYGSKSFVFEKTSSQLMELPAPEDINSVDLDTEDLQQETKSQNDKQSLRNDNTSNFIAGANARTKACPGAAKLSHEAKKIDNQTSNQFQRSPHQQFVTECFINLMSDVKEIKNDLKQMKLDLENLKSKPPQGTNSIINLKQLCEKYGYQIPFQNVEEFTNFDKALSTDKSLYEDVCTILKTCNDSTFVISRSIVNMLKMFLEKDVANKYVAVRKVKDKITMSKTTFYNCIEAAEAGEAAEAKAADDGPECVSRIASEVESCAPEDKKQDKTVVNGRMDNCGGGGQRLPPDGDEFPAAYQEFTASSQQQQHHHQQQQQYQYVTSRETMAANGDVDRGESVVDGTIHVAKTSSLSIAELAPEKRVSSNYSVYNTEKSIDVAAYFGQDEDEVGGGSVPPPLPLTGPPNRASDRKFSNGELWRQDNKSEKSVKDKIAMFSSQSSLESPLFPSTIVATATTTTTVSTGRRLSKHKSSDDVFADDNKPRVPMVERTQSSFDLSPTYAKPPPSLPQSSPPTSPTTYSNGYSNATNFLQKSPPDVPAKYIVTSSPAKPIPTATPAYVAAPYVNTSPKSLTRATSFSDRLQTSNEVLTGNTVTPVLARTNSLASTFKRPAGEDARKTSLSQLIEQRRKGISKLRGLVIPEKDAVPIDQPIMDLPEIKSRDSILVNQIPRSNIQDKWGSQSSLVSNASTVSSSVRQSGTFKMPAPKILSSYSPAFKRKSLTVYGNSNSTATSPVKNGGGNNQLASPDAPKSLESICSPTRSDYSFDFVSSSGSPENNQSTTVNSKPKMSHSQRKIGRSELYDDSDNDSAVSSSQSSISRGFSPPMSPVPSDRSTISERSYLSSDPQQPYPTQRSQLIIDNNGTSRGNSLYARSFSMSDKPPAPKPTNTTTTTTTNAVSQIPQRQPLKRSSSNETTSTITSSTSTLSAESLSRRVLKPQSVEAINRKNILASARCRSGRDLNGSPLIQRKFNDDEEDGGDAGEGEKMVNGGYKMVNGNGDATKPQIKIAYIEITENVVGDGEKFATNKEEVMMQPPPRLPPKRSVIPQAKNVPIPTTRPSKPEPLEPSNDMKTWVRAEMRTLASNNVNSVNSFDPRKKSPSLERNGSIANGNSYRSKSSLTLNEPRSQHGEDDVDLPRIRGKQLDDPNDLITVLTTKSRSRSAIHVEDSSYGKLRSPMSLEDILASKSISADNSPSKLPRSQSITSDSRNGGNTFSTTAAPRSVRRSNSTDSWAIEERAASKIPSLGGGSGGSRCKLDCDEVEVGERGKTTGSKIPMARNLGRRSSSVTDMKKVFEKPEMSSSSGTSSPGGQMTGTAAQVTHNRFPSLDSSGVEDNLSLRPTMTSGVGVVETIGVDPERFSGEQFGSISSLASSTSLITQQELAQLLEEATLEEPRGGHDVIVVLLHKENPAGSVGITLAGGVDCETKEITIHRVLSHSIADKEGSVQRGDRILSINGRSMRGLTHRESLAVLKQPRSEVVLVVSRAKLEDGSGGAGGRLRSRTESVETIVEGYETNGVAENTAWGPALMVAVYKDGAGLGFSLEGGRDSPLGDRPLLIKKIFTGGAAEKTGALRAGDQLLEVNKRDVSRMSRIEAWSLMKKLPDGEVNLLVRHPATKSS